MPSQVEAPMLKESLIDLGFEGWNFYLVDQVRGKCNFTNRYITIPIHAIQEKKKGYLEWYVAHELSHAYAGFEAMHGPLFMAQLLRLCPKDFLHFETSYKPRYAQAAGISHKPGHTAYKIGKQVHHINDADWMEG